MINSRNISDLRPDVAANCRVWLELCKAQGINAMVTDTVRCQLYQDDCIRRGTAPPGSVPTFHAVGTGLAFDFCELLPNGRASWTVEFSRRAAAVAKQMGFSWGGDWVKPDNPHLQWDDGGRTTNADILAGRLPPPMPPYQAPAPDSPSAWAAKAWAWATEAGITDGTRPGAPCTREQVITMLHRFAVRQGGATP